MIVLRVFVAIVALVVAAVLVAWARRRRASLIADEDWHYIDRNIMIGQVGIACCLVIAAVRITLAGF